MYIYMKQTTIKIMENLKTLKIGSKVKYLNHHKKTVVGTVTKLFQEEGRNRAIVTHSGKFKHYFDVNIGQFALTVI